MSSIQLQNGLSFDYFAPALAEKNEEERAVREAAHGLMGYDVGFSFKNKTKLDAPPIHGATNLLRTCFGSPDPFRAVKTRMRPWPVLKGFLGSIKMSEAVADCGAPAESALTRFRDKFASDDPYTLIGYVQFTPGQICCHKPPISAASHPISDELYPMRFFPTKVIQAWIVGMAAFEWEFKCESNLDSQEDFDDFVFAYLEKFRNHLYHAAEEPKDLRPGHMARLACDCAVGRIQKFVQ